MRLGPAPSVHEHRRFAPSAPGRDYPARWIYADSLLSLPGGEKHEFVHLAHPDYDSGLVWARVRERDGTAQLSHLSVNGDEVALPGDEQASD